MKTFTALALGAAVLSSTSCRDDFAEMNSNPSNITTPEASYLFTRGILEFEPAAYLLWYYNTPMMTQWAQLSASTGGYLPNFVITTANGGQGSQYLSTLKYVRALENYRSTLSEEDAKDFIRKSIESAFMTREQLKEKVAKNFTKLMFDVLGDE